MESRALGKTGIEVSAFGLGTWEFGGLWWGPIDAHDSVALLHRAFDLGVTTYDASDAYGNGRSEVILGEAFRGRRHETVLITKSGYLVGIDGAQTLFLQRDAPQPQCYEPWYIRNECELSLRRLQTDYIDIYLLHDPPLDVVKREEPWETLRELKLAGKVRSIGLSSSTASCLEAVRRGHAEVVEVSYSVALQEAAAELFPLCAEKGVGVLARSPFASGRLFQDEALVARLTENLVKPPIASLHEAAVKFVLSHPHVASCITGVMKAEELDANVRAAQPPYLSAEQRNLVEAM
jgi:aryl-alcohol dehydrogenase-like predicted oxidoreductase